MEVLYLSDCRGQKNALTLSTLYKHKVCFFWSKNLLIDIPFYLKKKKFDVLIIDNVGIFKICDKLLITINNLLYSLQIPYIIVTPLCNLDYQWPVIIEKGFEGFKRIQNLKTQFNINTVHIQDHNKQHDLLQLARDNIDLFYKQYKKEEFLLIHKTPVLPFVFHDLLIELVNEKITSQLTTPKRLPYAQAIGVRIIPINKHIHTSIHIRGNFILYGLTHERWHGSSTCSINDKEIWSWSWSCLLAEKDIIYIRNCKQVTELIINVSPGEKNEYPAIKGHFKYEGEQYIKLHELYFSGNITDVLIDNKVIQCIEPLISNTDDIYTYENTLVS